MFNPSQRMLLTHSILNSQSSSVQNRSGSSRLWGWSLVSFRLGREEEDERLTASAGIKILGFKDRDTLRFQDQLKHAYFIYPDEKVPPTRPHNYPIHVSHRRPGLSRSTQGAHAPSTPSSKLR